mmetsp:Transcript_8095/g.26786  ORF Transcript_8095/g.26786 Transcript_8095/m.26786 type:complete len:387 (+) Transcript_8095:477-1637(+)
MFRRRGIRGTASIFLFVVLPLLSGMSVSLNKKSFAARQQYLSPAFATQTAFENDEVTRSFTCLRGARSAALGYAVAFDGNERFGRLGNVMLAVRYMIIHAYRTGCSVELPPTLIGMPRFTASCLLLQYHGPNKASVKSSCPIMRPVGWFQQPAGRISHTESAALSIALGWYTGTNRTHAYGATCSGRPSIAVHLRAGDVTSGTFDSEGNFLSSKCYRNYSSRGCKAIQTRYLYPTSFYVYALSQILSNTFDHSDGVRTVGVYSHGHSNPTSTFFRHASIMSPNIRNYYDRDLLEDVRDMTCASHLLLSRGTFGNAVTIRSSQVVHQFVNDRNVESHCPFSYYYRLRSGLQYMKLANNWHNSAQNRSTIDTDYAMIRNPCESSPQPR